MGVSVSKTLCDLWSEGSVHGKSIAALVPWAGKVSDDSQGSEDLRAFFRLVDDSLLLAEYVNQSLTRGFEDAELVLQDLINEIGIRLGFLVEHGRYRGKQNAIGFDGIWRSQDHSFVVEIKTSDVHSIKIDTIAKYRKRLIEQSRIEEADSSILIIVGGFNTDAFECQVRGSKHAWDIRLLSVQSLLKLLFTKEAVDDSSVFDRIIKILQPRDFTKLDEIVELVFSTATEVEAEIVEEEIASDESSVLERIKRLQKLILLRSVSIRSVWKGHPNLLESTSSGILSMVGLVLQERSRFK